MAELVQKASIRATIAEMSVGEMIGLACDIVPANTLRHYASILSFEMNRRYSVHLNRSNRTYEIIRHE